MSNAKVMTIDFSKGPSIRQHSSGVIRYRGNANDLRPVNEEGKLLTPKQIRARARRKAEKNRRSIMSETEFEALYKPIEEWDLEELARGRPRNVDGNFRGRKPSWITREVHERAMEVFVETTRAEMGSLTPDALDTLRWVLKNEEVDDKGKPLVPASAKNQASMFLIEHVVGKPKQHVTQDISVKLQGILGSVMVNPADAMGPQASEPLALAHYPGQTIPIGLQDRDDSDSDLDPRDG